MIVVISLTTHNSYFEIRLAEVNKGINALKHKIQKKLGSINPDSEEDMQIFLESEHIDGDILINKIFHKGEIYSGEEIVLKLSSIKGHDVKVRNFVYDSKLTDVDKGKKYKVISEEHSYQCLEPKKCSNSEHRKAYFVD